MIKRIAPLLLVLFLMLISFKLTQAQAETVISSIMVDLWPEFDRPSMLVIYHMTLSPQVNLPAEISFPIPRSAGSPHAVAIKQPDNNLISVPYTLERRDDWRFVVFQATAPEIQLEYYDFSLIMDGVDRFYTYSWPGAYPVDAFILTIQQPRSASGMLFRPSMFAAKSGADGLTYYLMNVGALTIGQQFEVSLTYQKETDVLSYSDMPVAPVEPLNDTTVGFTNLSGKLPWVLGSLGLLLIFGGALWYWRTGLKKTGSRSIEYILQKIENTPTQSQSGEIEFAYCPACGKRASPGDRFCRTCGTVLHPQQ